MSTPCDALKDALYEQLTRLTSAMSHPKRLLTLDLLAQGPRTVEVLAREIGMSVASTSQHLRALKQARLVESEKSGLYVTYRLADEYVYRLLDALRDVGDSRLAEIEQIVRQARAGRAFEPMTRQEAMQCLRKRESVLVDVRPKEEYDAGHIPSAISIPLAELDQRLEELPKEKLIVVYCRGTYCFLALQAVELLRQKGFRARHLEEGVRDFSASGVKLETG
ncbi:MAG: metalloregulator ArsR/SmtB family transcription factor [Armatimonadia bacterium]